MESGTPMVASKDFVQCSVVAILCSATWLQSVPCLIGAEIDQRLATGAKLMYAVIESIGVAAYRGPQDRYTNQGTTRPIGRLLGERS